MQCLTRKIHDDDFVRSGFSSLSGTSARLSRASSPSAIFIGAVRPRCRHNASLRNSVVMRTTRFASLLTGSKPLIVLSWTQRVLDDTSIVAQ